MAANGLLPSRTTKVREERTVKGLIIAGLIAAFIGFSGCGGGGAKVQTETRATTTGQELTDLDKAYKQGIITEEEYKKQRKKILEPE
jgi:hypothetical protein